MSSVLLEDMVTVVVLNFDEKQTLPFHTVMSWKFTEAELDDSMAFFGAALVATRRS